MEESVTVVVGQLLAKFPIGIAVYTGLSGVYMVFCAIASVTKSKEDDKVADKLKRFFSLPISK